MSNNSQLFEAARDYGALGLPLLPLHTPVKSGGCSCGKPECQHVGKHPRWNKDDLPSGFNSASTDQALIEKWYTRWPDANVGLKTGRESGFFVLDVDDSEGEESLKQLVAKHGELPQTWKVRTGRGWHFYFKHPGKGSIPSRNGHLGKGLDIKADGGSVVAPPSLHASGHHYEWMPGQSPNDIPLAEAPSWLLDRTKNESPTKNKTPSDNTKKDFSLVLNGVADGQRDELINRYVWSRLTRGVSPNEVKVLVVEVARNCDPPFDEAEALKKVDRAIAKFPQRVGEGINLTDMGNAQRMARLYGHKIRHSKHLGWLVYDGKRWVPDDLAQVQHFAKETVRNILAEAAKESDDDRRKSLASFALKCESAPRIQAMVQLLPSEPGISVPPDVFDRDKMLLNVLNGTIDLRTRQLRPHCPDDLITKLAPVTYDPDARCPRFEQFMVEIMNGDQTLVAYVQRGLGYSLTGETCEQVWFFLWGKGENGKGTLMTVVVYVMGDYAVNTPAETFLETTSTGIRNDLARLRGARIVTASEPQTKKFDPAVLKTFSGQDPITARFLHREHFEFYPEGKLFFSANHRPAVRDTSHAFWRRVQLIPFNRIFSGRDKDDKLRERLQEEAPGILNWMVQGCLQWQKEGLNPPEVVRLAVNDYRSETDVLADFLEVNCIIEYGQSVPVAELYERYQSYCDDKKIHKGMSKHRFNEDLLGRPGILREKIGPSHHRILTWTGIGLRHEGNGSQSRSCSDCNLRGSPCPKGEEDRTASTCQYYERYN